MFANYAKSFIGQNQIPSVHLLATETSSCAYSRPHQMKESKRNHEDDCKWEI